MTDIYYSPPNSIPHKGYGGYFVKSFFLRSIDGISMHLLRAEYHPGAFDYYPPVLEKDGKEYTFNGSASIKAPIKGYKHFELTFQSDNPDMNVYNIYTDPLLTSVIKFKTDKGTYNCIVAKGDKNAVDCATYRSDSKNIFPTGFLTVFLSVPKDETVTSVTVKKSIVHGDVNVIYVSEK